ncbi:MAG: AMP-binding protein [Bacteroidales bacterium]|nr:AMP-binding protein [Bacteroidales bacterium]
MEGAAYTTLIVMITINGIVYSVCEIMSWAEKMIRKAETPEWEKDLYAFLLAWYDDSDRIEQQTSGSTRHPRNLRLLKTHMENSARQTAQFFQLQNGDNALLCLSTNYIAGKMMVVRAIVQGLNLITVPPASLPQVPEVPVHLAAMVPFQVSGLLNYQKKFDTIKRLLLGGSPVDSLLRERLHWFPGDVYATYGMTETCSHIAVQRLNGTNPDKGFVPLPGVNVSLNANSCLIINAPMVSSGVVYTTDRATVMPDGTFQIHGRVDFVINSGGIKIYPEMVEKELAEKLRRRVMLVGIPDPILGQRAVLVLEGEPADGLPKDLLFYFKENKKTAPIAKQVVYLKEFPVNQFMKSDRREVLRQVFILLKENLQ